ncbi:tetratricopeptide repeat protein, partial [bacterium]|nr:tetratricopeptide repeat protein [bacterium]
LAMGYGTRLMQGGLSAMFYVGKFKKECETAVKLDPSNVRAHMALLQYYSMAPGVMGGSDEKAAETARTIAELDPFMGHIADGFLAESAEDSAAAEMAYTAAANADTAEPQGWRALGMFYMRSEQYEKAIPMGERAARLAPDEANGPYQIGEAYLMIGEDLDEAERWFRRAIEILEEQSYPRAHMLASAHWRLGMISERRGDLAAARSNWEEALRVETGHEQASAALDSLTAVLPAGR